MSECYSSGSKALSCAFRWVNGSHDSSLCQYQIFSPLEIPVLCTMLKFKLTLLIDLKVNMT